MSLPFEVALAPGYGRTRKSQTALVEPRILRRGFDLGRFRLLVWPRPTADSKEKHEPASDIDTVVVDSLKALDPNRPIREANKSLRRIKWRLGPSAEPWASLQLLALWNRRPPRPRSHEATSYLR
jgi:hypothetical protein